MTPLDMTFTLQHSLQGLTAVLGLGIIYLIGIAIYNVYFHPLANYPGPKWCAISRGPFLWALINGEQTRNVAKLHRIYGDVVRIAPNELSYTNPTAWKDVYANRQGKPEMGKYLIVYNKHQGNQIAIADRIDHSRFRKNLSYGFSDTSLRDQEPLLMSYVNLLLQRIEQASSGGEKAIDMCEWYNYTTFDIIGHLTFGESFDCLAKNTLHPWVALIMNSFRLGAYMQALRYIPFSTHIASFLVSSERIQKKKMHDQLTVEKVKARVAVEDDRKDFLDRILKKGDEGFSFQELVSHSSVLIVAGSETTASALSGITFNLLSNPSTLAKLIAEVRGAFKSDDEINGLQVAQLKYLQACITEGLRMFPPAPVGFPRVVPEGGDIIAGKWVPGGMVVNVSQLATFRSAQNFRNPDSFVPERFLGDEMYAEDSTIALNPFSLGPRNCIGKNLAYAEMRLIIAKIIWNFDMQLVTGKDWPEQKSYMVWEKKPLMIKFTKVIR
ncbi:hypothetical protein VTL71DRAFT_6305 [Oculimacula yallundae]|uniref:Cytochrome P450 n=1 Tax=Oculimacula yallundae TaxID=86028 RepID=A0ABR4BWL6_9HELO